MRFTRSARTAVRLLVALLLMVPLAAACTGLREKVSIGDVAWLANGRIYYIARLDGEPNPVRSTRPGKLDKVPTNIAASCEAADHQLRALADGAMAVSTYCAGGSGTQLVRYDGSSTTWGSTGGKVRAVWSPTTGAGYVDRSDVAHCTQLGRVGQHATEPLWIDVGGARTRADLLDPAGTCDLAGPNVGWPLPEGDTLFFFASTAAKGTSDTERQTAPWTLFRAGPDGVGRRVIDGLADLRGAAATPDGKRLAVSAIRDGKRGVWLVDPDGASAVKLADGYFESVAFSPAGDRLAAVLNGGAEDDEIRIFKVK